MTNPQLVYIAGYGHSGSTLLNYILGSADECFALGELMEIKKFYHQLREINSPRRCDCGEILHECPFWNGVMEAYDGDLYTHREDVWERIETVLGIHTPYELSFDYDDFFHVVLNQARKEKGEQVEYLIDSSKDPRRLHILTDNVDVHVLHLVRDLRGVVHSCERDGTHWLRTAHNWLVANNSVARLQDAAKSYHVVSYDRFCQTPTEHLRRLADQFEITLDTHDPLGAADEEDYHVFAGNTVETGEDAEIYHSTSWQHEMPRWKQRLLGLIAYRPHQRWVYQ